jgi:hypothetical protein
MTIKEIAQGVVGALFIWVLLVLVFTAGSL